MDGIYQLTIGGNNANGEFGENVCHYQVTGTSGSDDAYTTAVALASAWVTAFLANLEQCCGTDVQLNIMTVKKISAPVGPTMFNAISAIGTGGALSSTFAQAVDIRLLPGGGGNRAGHWYMWGLPLGSFLGGIIDPTFTADVVTFANQFLVALNVLGGTANLGTYTRKTQTIELVTDYEIVYDKVTAMNKRTIPVL